MDRRRSASGRSLADVLLIVAVAVVGGLVGLPFSYAHTFGIEAKFGFNRTTRALWLADLAKGVAVGRRRSACRSPRSCCG